MAKLWDELEAARSDCAFLFITHDLEFAASRVAQKFVIRDYDPKPFWTLEIVPGNIGFDEEITTLILGSRRPILFIEGRETSLDLAIYRSCYPEWTVIPRGSCEEVIHSVVTMRRNASLTRVTCSGLVDADDYDATDMANLRDLGIATLPVSEIENIIILPTVSRAIAEMEGYSGTDLEDRLAALKSGVLASVSAPKAVNSVISRYCRRRIDRMLKKIDLSSAETVPEIAAEYEQKTKALDVADIARGAEQRMSDAVARQDLPALLAVYDNKGMMALAALHLKPSRMTDFEGWLLRMLKSGKNIPLTSAIRSVLPMITPA